MGSARFALVHVSELFIYDETLHRKVVMILTSGNRDTNLISKYTVIACTGKTRGTDLLRPVRKGKHARQIIPDFLPFIPIPFLHHGEAAAAELVLRPPVLRLVKPIRRVPP